MVILDTLIDFTLLLTYLLSYLLTWMPFCNKEIVSTKPRPNSAYDFFDVVYCFIVLLCACLVPRPYTIFLICSCGTIYPVYAESAVKHQPTIDIDVADGDCCQGDAAQRQQRDGQQEPVDLLVADADVARHHVHGHDDADDPAAGGAGPAADRPEPLLLPRREPSRLASLRVSELERG